VTNEGLPSFPSSPLRCRPCRHMPPALAPFASSLCFFLSTIISYPHRQQASWLPRPSLRLSFLSSTASLSPPRLLSLMMSSIPLGSPHEPIPPCRSPRPPSSSSSTTSLHLLPPQHPTPVLHGPLLRLNNRSSNRLDATSYRQSQRLCWLKPALLLRKENRRRGHRRTVGFVFLWQEEGS
jgi:hypothetical protein